MNDEEKRKIEKEVLTYITLALQSEGIDFLKLDPKTIDLIIRGFQLGIEFTEKKKKEIEALALKEIEKRTLNDIPY